MPALEVNRNVLAFSGCLRVDRARAVGGRERAAARGLAAPAPEARMTYPLVSLLHIGFAVVAILTGCVVLLRVKGTRVHRRLGFLYCASMVILNVSSCFIFSLTGEASLFHALAAFSLLTVLIGYAAAAWRIPRGGWLELHQHFMAWSYIGLLAAAAAEAAVRIPETRFWWAVVAASFTVIAAGGIVLATRLPGLRARYGSLASRGQP